MAVGAIAALFVIKRLDGVWTDVINIFSNPKKIIMCCWFCIWYFVDSRHILGR